MTPTDFTNNVNAWAGAVVTVVAAVAAAVALVAPKLAAIAADIRSLKDGHAANQADLRSVNEQLTAVAQAQVPPAQAVSAPQAYIPVQAAPAVQQAIPLPGATISPPPPGSVGGSPS